MRANRRLGFSLMEMMIVLLIVAIIAAASAPFVTKKLTRNGTNESPWVFTGLGNSIGYNMNGGNNTAIIGAAQARGNNNPRLYIQTQNTNQPAITFGMLNPAQIANIFELYASTDSVNGNPVGRIALTNGGRTPNIGAVVIGANTNNNQYSVVIGNNASATQAYSVALGPGPGTSSETTVAIGRGTWIMENAAEAVAIGRAQIYKDSANSIAIGNATIGSVENNTQVGSAKYSVAIGKAQVTKNSSNSIAIGTGACSFGSNAVAIGSSSQSTSYGCAIGRKANVTGGNYSIAIGGGAQATQSSAIAIGSEAKALHSSSTAIGAYATTTASNQIMLGRPSDTVVIPGNLVVDKSVILGGKEGTIYMRGGGHLFKINGHGSEYGTHYVKGYGKSSDTYNVGTESRKSDRRLKNVGEKYTAGLEELKKLDFFHYTFKKDENKTPRVGVIAQDLQKVFPDAVIKGEDGYLLIRTEDMFYAVINAVKELDSKISALVEKVDSIVEDITTMKATIEAQQKTIDELKAQNEEIIKTNEKIMKRLEKLEKKKLSKVEE